MFCGKDLGSDIVFTHLKDHHNLVGVVSELPPSKKRLLKNRIKRLGVGVVIFQLVFMKIAVPLVNFFSRKRLGEIRKMFSIESIETFDDHLFVPSINDPKVREFVSQVKPDAIVVNGTRIIGKKLLNAVDSPMVNIHVGITPKYRGVHGGYWALVNDDPEIGRAHV